MLQKIKSRISDKKFWVCILIFEICVCGVFCFRYSKKEPVELNYTQDDLLYDSGEQGFYLDKSYEGKYIASPMFMLPKGLYTLDVQYECKGDAEVTIHHMDNPFDGDISGDVAPSDSGEISYDFEVKYNDRPIQIQGRSAQNMEEDEYLLIRNIHIVQAASAFRNYLFQIVLVFILINVIAFLFIYRDKLSIIGT
ncbi:MAG: hypothetical protein K2J99_08125, partial [Lachnospiraceae bacterium]|nr:hypothetical protein [Lachnospiraceae bacterium]